MQQYSKKNITSLSAEERKIDTLLEAVINKFPNYKENPIVREKATRELDRKIDSVLSLGYLNDIPLKVFRMGKNPVGDGALVQFRTDNYNYEKEELLSDRLNFGILGFVDIKLASELKEDGSYIIYARKLKRLDEREVFSIVDQVYYSSDTEIIKDAIWNVYNFNIGNMLCEIDSVKLIE